MSFFSDLFQGNFSNLGEDLFGSPTAIAETLGAVALPFLGAAALPALAGGAADIGAVGAATGAADLSTLGGAGAAGLGAGVDATAGLAAADAAGGGVLSDAAIGDLIVSPGSQAFASLTAPTVTGADAGASVGAGVGSLGVDPSLSAVPSVADFGGVGGGSDLPLWMTQPDVATTGGAFPAAGPGAVAPSNAAVGAGGTPNVFGPSPSVFDTGAPSALLPGGPVAAPPAAQGPGVLSTIGSTLKDIAPAAGVAGLGLNLYQGYQSQQQLKALQQQETNYQNTIAGAGQAALTAAQPLLATGTALTQGGPLPAPIQALLNNYSQQQKARIIQGYAARDPTNPAAADPKQNSALAQELNAVDMNMLALQENIGNQMITTANSMLTSGASSTQIAAELPLMVQRLDIALQQQTGNAIANFASAMSGGTMKVSGQGTGGINLNVNTPGQTTTQSLLGP